jgi:hypothetical protein
MKMCNGGKAFSPPAWMPGVFCNLQREQTSNPFSPTDAQFGRLLFSEDYSCNWNDRSLVEVFVHRNEDDYKNHLALRTSQDV